eukprot:1159068-Pelagomonas_calceolata.AAC.9
MPWQGGGSGGPSGVVWKYLLHKYQHALTLVLTGMLNGVRKTIPSLSKGGQGGVRSCHVLSIATSKSKPDVPSKPYVYRPWRYSHEAAYRAEINPSRTPKGLMVLQSRINSAARK